MKLKQKFYETYKEARAACIKLEINTVAEYNKRRYEDPMLPSAPYQKYVNDWKGYGHYFGRSEVKIYDYEEAKSAALRLGITSAQSYQDTYKQDPHLPSRPDVQYAIHWTSWDEFLDKEEKYQDFFEARLIARSYNFRTIQDYRDTCASIDPQLYAAPHLIYKEWNGWYDYLGIEKRPTLLTYEDAKAFVVKNAIKTRRQYIEYRQLHPELPSNPDLCYKKHWVDWHTFLQQKPAPYNHYLEAQQAARAAGISTPEEYAACYLEEDPKLPKNPAKTYKDCWRGWEEFLGTAPKYKHINQATEAIQTLGIKTKAEYLNRFREDALLPRCPEIIYKDQWPESGWRVFLHGAFYSTMQSAGAAARKLGVVTMKDYAELAHLDPKLPLTPCAVYKECKSWIQFILPERCGSYEEAKFAVKVIGIKNSAEYRQKQSLYPCLPANPHRDFSNDWVDWYEFCDITQPYSFDEAKELLKNLNITSAADYKKHIVASNDRRFPLTPDKVYQASWINWADYLGREQPYTIVTIPKSHAAWQYVLGSHLKAVKSGVVKENYLVRFVRDFLVPLKIGQDPIAVFTTDRFTLTEFELFIGSIKDTQQRKTVHALREFAECFIKENLCIICEDTGERTLIPGARDPFAPLNKEIGIAISPTETVKPALAYHFVDELKNWIIPPTASSFSDLTHLHKFQADWFDIDEDKIDHDDPDCIWKCEKGKYKIWFPGSWMHTYALASVPVRGIQLAYVDSGEGDNEIPVFEDGKISWIPNPSPFRGCKKNQGFVKKYPDNELGMHITTNKTSRKRPEYDVPWIPESLAIWCVRLRNWQTKYNPISKPMRWEDCENTNLNLEDRKAKEENCFLFRDLHKEECIESFGVRLGCRIAIALYNIQPPEIELATLHGDPDKVSSYSSRYTAHTMRVSLITAYVMEFRLPLADIVKIAGHSSVIMTIYYVKANGEMLRMKFEEGEKRALADRAKAVWQKVQQGRTNAVKGQLITNNEEAIKRFVGDIAAGSALFRDYGLCTFAGGRCHDGYLNEIGKAIAVPAGYLGSDNCIRCRHFVTGPIFLGGLLSLGNEISLSARMQFDHLDSMEHEVAKIEDRLRELGFQQHDAEAAGLVFDETPISELEIEKLAIKGQIETASQKANMYLSDMNSINRLAKQCQAIMNERIENDDNADSTQLIMHSDHETTLQIEETSFFHQLNEVCENAEIYISAKAELAVTPRTQLLDRMIQFNEMKPSLFMLDAKQQLAIGNQLTKFMLSRLKSWTKLDAVVDGRILMRDLPEHERLSEHSIQKLISGAKAQELLGIESDDGSHFRHSSRQSKNANSTLQSRVLIEYEEEVFV
ncbi:gamma-mobile-trio integrase GmtZ [Pseudomonas amygdali]|uniref:gamma-mobile-trio integrase GmtZ n=1 Tax=Pseudomonas amygdali TaxID=47877 RepID=UPI000E3BBA64|nr:VPA1269 family protein [Pseudomonas amygdali]